MTKVLTQEQLEFRSKIYTGIFWTSLAVILLWYILKSTGLVQTPLWFELLPFAAATFGAGAFFRQITIDIRDLKMRTTHLEKDMHYVKANI
ncbi:MAG: hypothetical protein Q8R00_04605 [Candidatus Nanoarchaeia archaeon]|nr:hypothetical protein [Candidatus Nanoarchaeia archaeon]